MPSIALVIVNYNSGRLLDRCMRAVRKQTLSPDRIIVVDNASTDGSLSAIGAGDPDIEVLRLDENIGFAAANNRALETCGEFEFVALLNPDAFPEPSWLQELIEAAQEKPNAGSFASCLVSADNPNRLDGAGDAYHVSGLVWRIGHGNPVPSNQDVRQVFAPCAAAALYRTSAIRDVGGFDETYFCYNEDVDLGFRMRLRKWKSWYVPNAVAQHVGSAVTGSHSDFSLYHGHRNLVWTYLKNMPDRLLLRYLWQHLLLNLVSIVFVSTRYRTTAIVRGKIAALSGLKRILTERRRVQAGRTCSDSDLVDAMTKGWWRCYVGRRRVL